MKKSFTLMEILISITLFSIIILFLYGTLDITQKSNLFYSKQLEVKQENNRLEKIIFSDLINMKLDGTVVITEDKNKNNIITFQSNNSYHNPFYKNITYLITRENNLVRIESKDIFDSLKLEDSFFDYSYIDILKKNIKKMKIHKGENINFYIEFENKKKLIFSF